MHGAAVGRARPDLAFAAAGCEGEGRIHAQNPCQNPCQKPLLKPLPEPLPKPQQEPLQKPCQEPLSQTPCHNFLREVSGAKSPPPKPLLLLPIHRFVLAGFRKSNLSARVQLRNGQLGAPELLFNSRAGTCPARDQSRPPSRGSGLILGWTGAGSGRKDGQEAASCPPYLAPPTVSIASCLSNDGSLGESRMPEPKG